MTIKKLKALIAEHQEGAEAGDAKSQAVIVNAEAEIERLKWEWSKMVRSAEMDNQDHAWRSRERNWGVENE